MPGIAEQIRSLVRSATNHGRRIRRLESIQTPVTIARPQGGHIIQDEGIPLTDRVYLNFVGVRVDASDDPDSGATIITVSDPEGDDFCRVVPLDVGWQINVGTESRYMKHSTAFQLSAGGNTRGAYSIDFSQEHTDPDAVAAGEKCTLIAYERSTIEADCGENYLIGDFNDILDNSWNNFIVGYSNTIDGSVDIDFIFGLANTSEDGAYGNLITGGYHTVTGGRGSALFNEGNTLTAGVSDEPWYCFQAGISNELTNDTFLCFQFGEQLEMVGNSHPAQTTLWCYQFGFGQYFEDVQHNYGFGYGLGSEGNGAEEFLNGRILFSGDWPNEFSGQTASGFGFNQNSEFAQNDRISNWTVAWQTSRFEFPILDDSVWGFRAYILGIEQGAANSYNWEIRGTVENDGGTTTILESTVTNNHRDVVTKEWQVVADDPNDRLVFQYRDTNGPDATNCNIQFSMFTIEVGYD